MKSAAIALLVCLTLMTVGGDVIRAQTASTQEQALRRDIEQRYDVLPLQAGLALRPKRQNPAVRSIEISSGAIAIDGRAVTGAELRTAVGADADLVLRLSYLDADARQRLFGGGTPQAAPAPPSPPSPPAPPTPPNPPETPRRELRGRENDRIRFAGNVEVAENEVIAGDVVALGGAVRVDGEVMGNAVAIGGGLTLGPHANLHGDAVAIGGGLDRDPGARVGGRVVNVGGPGRVDISGRRRAVQFRRFGTWFNSFSRPLALFTTVARLILLCALASLVLLLGRDFVSRVSARASAEPVVSGAVGLLAQLLFMPLLIITVLILIVTIVGIPLILLVPFGVLALMIVGLVGFTAVTSRLGHFLYQHFNWAERNDYVTTMAGIALLLSPLLLGRVIGLAGGILTPIAAVFAFLGFVGEYLAWTIGFGAVALMRFRRTSTSGPATEATPTPA